jgi:hypothetical protein
MRLSRSRPDRAESMSRQEPGGYDATGEAGVRRRDGNGCAVAASQSSFSSSAVLSWTLVLAKESRRTKDAFGFPLLLNRAPGADGALV